MGDFDYLFDDMDDPFGDTSPDPIETERPYIAPERGFWGDVGASALRGLTGLVETGAEAVEAVGIENSVDEWAREKRETSPWMAQDVSEYLGKDGLVKRGFTGMVEALPASLAPAGTGAIAGGMVGGPVGAVIGAVAGTFGFFGLGEGRKAYEEGLSQGLSEDEAKAYGAKKGFTEAGLESLAIFADIMVPMSGKLSKAALAARKAGKGIGIDDLLKLEPKKLAGDLLKVWGAENITEQAQLEIGAKIDEQYGLGEGVTWEERAEVMAVTTWMSLLFGGMGAGANITDRTRLKTQLQSENPVVRHNAAKVLHDRLQKADPTLANKFKEVWAEYGAEFQMDADIVAQAKNIPWERAEKEYDAYEPKMPEDGLVEKRKLERAYDMARRSAVERIRSSAAESAPANDAVLEEAGIPTDTTHDTSREETQLERLREQAGEFGDAITAAHRGEPVEEMPLERPRAADDPKLAANVQLIQEAQEKAKVEREAPIRQAAGISTEGVGLTAAEAMETRAARQAEAQQEQNLRGSAVAQQPQPEMVEPPPIPEGQRVATFTPQEEAQVEVGKSAVELAKEKYDIAVQAQDEVAMEEAMEELTVAFMEEESGVTVTPEMRRELSKEETDADQQRAIKSIKDPIAKDLVAGKVPEAAVDKAHAKLMKQYEEDMRDWEADPVEDRDKSKMPKKPSRNRALEDVIDEAVRREPGAAPIIRWESQELDASKTTAKKDTEGKVVEKRKKGDVNWIQREGAYRGESTDGKTKYNISSEGRFKHTLVKTKDGKSETVGTFKSLKEAQKAAEDAGVAHERVPAGKKKHRIKDKKTGELIPSAQIQKAFIADQIIKELADNPKLNVKQRVTTLNKYQTKKALATFLEKEKAARKKLRKGDATRTLRDANEAYLKGEELAPEEYNYMFEPEWKDRDLYDESPSDLGKATRSTKGGTFAVGELTADQKIQRSYMRAMMDNMGLKTTDLVVTDGSKADETLGKLMQQGDGFGQHANWMRGLNRKADASVRYNRENNTVYLNLNSKNMKEYSTAAQVEIVAHEFGHVVQHALFWQQPKKLQDKIIREYKKYIKEDLAGIIKEDGTMDIDAFYDEIHTQLVAQDRKRLSAKFKQRDMFSLAHIEHLEERTSFTEWFAEQTAKWATTDKKPLSQVDKFFKSIADYFRFLVAAMKGKDAKALPNAEVKKFLDDIYYRAKENRENLLENAMDAYGIELKRQKIDSWQFEEMLEWDSFGDTQALILELDLASEPPEVLDWEVVEEGSARPKEKMTLSKDKEAAMKVHRAATTRSVKMKKTARTQWDAIKDSASKAFESGIDIIEGISPRVGRKVNNWVRGISEHNAAYKERLMPFMKAMGKLKDHDRRRIGELVYNGYRNELAQEYPQIAKLMGEVDAILKDIHGRADAVGLIIHKELKDYYPRRIADLPGLEAFIRGSEDHSFIANELAAAEERAEKLGIEFTDQHRAEVINSILQTGRYFGSLRKPGSLEKRGIKFVTPELMEFYQDPVAGLLEHVYEMNESIGTQEFLGGKIRKRKLGELRRLNEKLNKAKEGSAEAIELSKQYNDLYQQLVEVQGETVLAESISDFIATELQDGKLKEDEVDIIADVIRARAMEKGMHGHLNSFRNVGLMTTLADFTSLITQASEIILNAYENGPINALQGLFSKKELDTAKFDLQRQMLEYQTGGSAKMVGAVLKYTGFAATDIMMKKAFLQSALIKARKSVRKDSFRKKWEPYFGKEDFLKLQKELRSGKAGALSTEMAWAQLMRYQPLDTIANPRAYMLGGQARIMYMLKTFQIRQANAIYREGIKKMRNGDVKAGLMNLMWLTSLIVLGGATKDEIRDLWLGREVPMREHIWDNLLNIVLFSRYDMDRAVDEGIGAQIIGKIIPPTNMIDMPVSDIYKTLNGNPSYKSLTMFPVVGKIAYDRFTPKGQEREQSKRKSYELDKVRKAIRSGDGGALREAKRNIKDYNRGVPKDQKITTSAVARTISAEKTKVERKKAHSVIAKHANRLSIPTGVAAANMEKFSELVAYAENRGRLTGGNPKSTAKGMYQITNDTMVTALNRLKRDVNYEPWMDEAVAHRNANKLNKDQQEALFLANLMYRKGTDALLRKVMMEGDLDAMTELYMKHHHTAPDPATKRNWQKAIDKVIGA